MCAMAPAQRPSNNYYRVFLAPSTRRANMTDAL